MNISKIILQLPNAEISATSKIIMFFQIYLTLVLLIKVATAIGGGFTFNGNIELQGVAEISTTGLFRLTNTSTFTIGHVFYASPLTFKNSSNGKALSFSTTFVIAIVADKSLPNGHGMAFVIAPSKELSGASSQHLGLFNRTNDGVPSNHVVAVEFDTFQNQEFNETNGNHVGIDINSLTSVKSAPAGYFIDANGEFKNISLASGERIQVWVDYDATRNQLNVSLSPIYVSKPNLPLLSLDVDISPIILDQMYVGFSSATGQLVQSHYVLGWSFEVEGKAQLDLSRLPSLSGPEEQFKSNKNKELAIGLSLAGVVLAAIVISFILVFKKKKNNFTEILEDWEVQYGPHRFSYKDLSQATNGFREKGLLGKGGFGEVYRGVLPVSKIQVAVKRISHNSKQGMKEFVAEIATIGRLRHPNLVRLLGYCRGKGELLLVYDYMPNASLDKFIYNKIQVTLNWNQRFKIIKDVATGLAYLHEEWVEVIVHRDIKASNVLLNGELNGKLGDFGLARSCKRAQDPQTTHVAGTFGYIAPELARNGKATISTDVYAYGAFCLEVACGRRPVESRLSMEEVNLVDWVYIHWREGKILSTVDYKLNKDFKVEEVELVLKLGLLCSHPVAEVRPRMSQVLLYLKGQASLPDNFDFQLLGHDRKGEPYNPATLNNSTPSFTVTESFKSVGR